MNALRCARQPLARQPKNKTRMNHWHQRSSTTLGCRGGLLLVLLSGSSLFGSKDLVLAEDSAVATALAPAEAEAEKKTVLAKKMAELLREVQAPEGFRATIFATPAEANYPVFVAATADGTLFVSSDGNGSLGRDPHRGRVVRLRDTDNDGHADQVKEFVADLDSPRGLIWVDNSLLVLHPPHVTAFADTDNDGVADTRTPLIRGIAFDYSQRPADHTSNGLALGPDGWIYAAIGDFGFMNAAGSDGRQLQLRGGGIVRFRPDGSGLSLFSRGTRNILEAAVSPLLDMIARDNTNDGGGWDVRLHALTGLEDHGYPRRYMHFPTEIIAPLADYGGGSGTGACWIDEPWMPAKWNNSPFTCDWGAGKIFQHPLTVKGASYEAGQNVFLGLTRATDLDVDAQGHLYAASWRGGNFKWEGPEIGFVACLTPEGATVTLAPDFEKASADELLLLLAGPSHRLRLESQRALVRRQMVAGIADKLQMLSADANAAMACRVAGLFTLALGQKADAIQAIETLAADPTLAAWAVRAIGDMAAEGIAVPRDSLRLALTAADARTRKEAIVALARTHDGLEAVFLLPLAADSDPIVSHTAIEALVEIAKSGSTAEPHVIAACTSVLDAPETLPIIHHAASRVLGELHTDAAVETVIAGLTAASDPARRADLVWAAARQFRREAAWKGDSWGTRPDTRGPYYAAEEWDASARLLPSLVAAMQNARGEELPALDRTLGLHRIKAEQIVPALLARAASEPAAQLAIVTFLDLDGSPPRDDVLTTLQTVAERSDLRATDRLAAIRVLARSQSPQVVSPLINAVVSLETAELPPETLFAARRSACDRVALASDINAICSQATASPGHAALVDEILLTVTGSGNAKSGVRGDAATRLLTDWTNDPARRLAIISASVRSKSTAMANAIVAAADQNEDQGLRENAATALTSLGIDAAKVREIAADTGPKLGERKPDEVLRLIEERRGDRTVGAELFATKKCNACHAVGVNSAGLGPSLANAAGIYNRRQLAESVLLPNKSIAQGFATTAVVLDDGRQFVGFVTSEAAEVIVLRDAQGVEHRINKPTIGDRQKLPTSIMPEGLVADLTVAQFASLIDYIEGVGK